MEVFINQKRVNVCEHTVNMAPRDFRVRAIRGRNKKKKDAGKREIELSEVNTRSVSGG